MPAPISWRLIATTLLVLVNGCSQPPVEEVEDSEILLGHLVWGHEVRTFTACGTTETGWIIDKTEGELRLLAQTGATQPYEKILVEIRGQLGPRLESGFGADFDYSLVVSSAERVSDQRQCD